MGSATGIRMGPIWAAHIRPYGTHIMGSLYGEAIWNDVLEVGNAENKIKAMGKMVTSDTIWNMFCKFELPRMFLKK